MIKRVYQRVDVHPVDDGFAIVLDQKKPVRSPSGNDLWVPVEALATAIAMEWDAQGEEIDSQAMRLTNLAGQAIDIIEVDRPRVEAAIVGYVETDLTCYRADSPADLVSRQAATWDPLLGWAKGRYGESPVVTVGVVPLVCDPTVVARYTDAVAALDRHELVALQTITSITGSIIIGLSALERQLDPDAVWNACQVDEAHQTSRWGEDSEAAQTRQLRRADLDAAMRFLALLR